MATKNTTQWNRDDRDLLIELRSGQTNMATRMLGVETSIKEFSVGITARILNLESNSVTRTITDAQDTRIRALEEAKAELTTQIKTWALMGGLLFTAAQVALSVFLHFYK